MAASQRPKTAAHAAWRPKSGKNQHHRRPHIFNRVTVALFRDASPAGIIGPYPLIIAAIVHSGLSLGAANSRSLSDAFYLENDDASLYFCFLRHWFSHVQIVLHV